MSLLTQRRSIQRESVNVVWRRKLKDLGNIPYFEGNSIISSEFGSHIQVKNEESEIA
ncbi:hypothetical protein PM082_014580 [Marasmius tenuissimus]|nr:hypothetical protein PM082_014580 [Marasmius tenuissimus]